MRLLAIDAATKGLGIAIAETDKLLAVASLDIGKTHSQRLLPLIDDLMREGGFSPRDLDGIAVTVGPGSFTGLRIGISTAKALAYAWQKQVVEVKTLDALAYNEVGRGALICPVLDARRNEVYYGVYDETARPLEPIGAMAPEALAEYLKKTYPEKRLLFLGDAAVLYQDMFRCQLGEWAEIAPPARRVFMADSAAFYALAHWEERKDPTGIRAFYLRPSAAEKQRLERLAAKHHD